MSLVNICTAICLCAALLRICDGCFINQSVERINVGGTERTVCEHNGVRYFAGTGHTFKTADCYECRCNEAFGLLCCGYGKNRQRVDYVGAEDCDIIEDRCMRYIVRKDDHTRSCYSGEPIHYEYGSKSALKNVLALLGKGR